MLGRGFKILIMDLFHVNSESALAIMMFAIALIIIMTAVVYALKSDDDREKKKHDITFIFIFSLMFIVFAIITLIYNYFKNGNAFS